MRVGMEEPVRERLLKEGAEIGARELDAIHVPGVHLLDVVERDTLDERERENSPTRVLPEDLRRTDTERLQGAAQLLRGASLVQEIELLMQGLLRLAIDLHQIDGPGEYVEQAEDRLGDPQVDGHAALDARMEDLHDDVLTAAQRGAMHLPHRGRGGRRAIECREHLERTGAKLRLNASGDQRICGGRDPV